MNTHFWKYKTKYNPDFDENLHLSFQKAFGYKLPESYVNLLKISNGGAPLLRYVKTDVKTSWAKDHILIIDLKGIKTNSNGTIDLQDSDYWAQQILEQPTTEFFVISDTPSGGHDVLMLDYRNCILPEDEPTVVHMDNEYKNPITIASNFDDFLNRLYHDPEDDD